MAAEAAPQKRYPVATVAASDLPWARVYHSSLSGFVFHLVWFETLAYYETKKAIQSMRMLIAIFFMRLFEVMFFAGIAGSAVVVVISFIEDLQLLVGE